MENEKTKQESVASWQEEEDDWASGMPYWKPKAGTYKITFLDEGKVVQKKKFGSEELQRVLQLKIDVDKQVFLWERRIARTPSSPYGQLKLLAKEWKSFVGKTATVKIRGSGMNTDYWIVEAEELVSRAEAEMKNLKEEKLVR